MDYAPGSAKPTSWNFWPVLTTRISSACLTVGIRIKSGWSFIFGRPPWVFSGPASLWPPVARSTSDTMRPRRISNTCWQHHEKHRWILFEQFGDVVGHDVQHAGG